MGCGTSHVDVKEHTKAPNAAAAVTPTNEVPLNRMSNKKALGPLIIFFLGGPSSGKGTQCQKLMEKFGFMHIIVGDLLRAEAAKGSDLGTKCERLMIEGKLVPVGVSLELIKSVMDSSKDKHFFIDGFPQSVDQAQAFEAKIARPDMVIYLECPIEIMEDRLLRRGETSGCTNDNAETIKERFNSFIRDSVSVLNYYENTSPVIVKKVSAALPPIDIFDEICNILKEAFGLQEKNAVHTFNHHQHNCNMTSFTLMLGGPGSGKGTQCELMVRDFGYTHLSTGDLLRSEIKSGSDMGKSIEHLIQEGQIVPLEMTLKLLQDAMEKASCRQFLIDGFPRAVEQASEFDSKVGKANLVIYLNCSIEVMEKRLLERGKSSGRSDDNINTIRKRFEAFLAESKPVVEYYRIAASDTLKEISGDKTIDEVYKEIKEIVMSNEQRTQQPNCQTAC